MTEMNTHKTVLLNESIAGLNLKEGAMVVDATLGGAGHSRAIAEAIGSGTLIAVDADARALEIARTRLAGLPATIKLVQGNFKDLTEILANEGVHEADAFLFDLGWSQNQMDDPHRGFSFRTEGPLFMRLGDAGDLTASDIVNHWNEAEITKVLSEYGEEQFASRIARGIVAARPIETTTQLAAVIETAVPAFYRNKRIHAATKTFQALRIAVNDELGVLTKALESAWRHTRSRGRIAVISFHSLEDRIVKHFFKEKAEKEEGKLITKKPIVPTDEEIELNQRSRSAKLRVIEKI